MKNRIITARIESLLCQGFSEKVALAESRRCYYTAAANWAARRYTRDGKLAVHIGGKPTMYSRIESSLWNKYVR